jgi:hypothetical protein
MKALNEMNQEIELEIPCHYCGIVRADIDYAIRTGLSADGIMCCDGLTGEAVSLTGDDEAEAS